MWTLVGAAVVVALLVGPRYWDVRGAPLQRSWGIAAFVAAWVWAGLRLIALWRWAWVVLAAVPVLLYVPLRPFVGGAAWLTPLLLVVAILSALIVVLVVAVERRGARRAESLEARPVEGDDLR